jgi:exodeoxyribonuclease VII large subunit
MERPLFDPGRVRTEPPARRDNPAAMLTPRQVNELVSGAVSRHVPATMHVLGEIGDFSRPSSGHWYFTLKDEHSELRAVMWRSAAVGVKFEPNVGLRVVASGSVEVYTPRGTYQLVVRRLEPHGVGARELALRQLCEKLTAEGLFDARRKRPLPRFPRRVAVITAERGAAFADICHTIERRYPALEIVLFAVRVQGDGAAAEIVAAVQAMNAMSESLGGIDVAIVGRGGGSAEDLWAFNEEIVARAVAGSRIPIVSAVGHEIDVSLCDLAADVRAATPTAAAELVAPRKEDVLAELSQRTQLAARAVARTLERGQSRLALLRAYDGLAKPLLCVQHGGQSLDERVSRLELRVAARLASSGQRLGRVRLALANLAAGGATRRLARRVSDAAERSARAVERLLRGADRAAAARLRRLEVAGPATRIERLREALRRSGERVETTMGKRLADQRQRINLLTAVVGACDPRRVLRRGFSITRDARTARVIRSVADAAAGTRIETEVADGRIRSTVEDSRQGRLFE